MKMCSSIMLNNAHMDEIKKQIASRSGNIISVKKVDREKSPFSDESGKYNIIYKITYEIDNINKYAWYRGINTVNNIHSQSPSPNGGGYGEKWMFE